MAHSRIMFFFPQEHSHPLNWWMPGDFKSVVKSYLKWLAYKNAAIEAGVEVVAPNSVQIRARKRNKTDAWADKTQFRNTSISFRLLEEVVQASLIKKQWKLLQNKN